MIYLIFAIVFIVCLFPVVWTFLTSIKTTLDAFSMPPKWLFEPSFKGYAEVIFELGFPKSLLNSAIVVSLSTLLSLAAGIPAAYALARFRLPGRENLAFFILSTRMMPSIAVLLPMFLLMKTLRLYGTPWALVLAYTFFNLPFVIWMLKGYVEELPIELDESAIVDGCSRFEVLRKIIVPLSTPAIVVTAAFCIIFSWNEFMLALLLTNPDSATAPVQIALTFGSSHGAKGLDWPALTAESIIATLPLLAFGIFMQKHLVRGLTLGAVKG